MSGTTTNYGWTYPTSTDYVKDGATAIQTVATGVDSTLGTALNNKLHAGLVLVKTQTVGSAVSSVTVTSAFSSTYDSYRIIYTGGTASAMNDIQFSLGGITTGYYSAFLYANYGVNTPAAATQNNTSAIQWLGRTNVSGTFFGCDVHDPFLTKVKYVAGHKIDNSNSGSTTGFIDSITSASAFTLAAQGGVTMTGGTIYVYGYAKD